MARACISSVADAVHGVQRTCFLHRARLSSTFRRCTADHQQPLPQRAKTNAAVALRHLQQGNIAPVDFARRRLAPAWPSTPATAASSTPAAKRWPWAPRSGIINQALTEVLSELEDDFDNDTRWAISWFEQSGFSEGDYGDAELLSKAKVTAVAGLQLGRNCSIEGRQGAPPVSGRFACRLGPCQRQAPDGLGDDAPPAASLPSREGRRRSHRCPTAKDRQPGRGREGTRLPLHNISERKKWSQEAQGYNALVLGWPEIARFAREMPAAAQAPSQGTLI